MYSSSFADAAMVIPVALLRASNLLTWLPPGQRPTEETFASSETQPALYLRQEIEWALKDAIECVVDIFIDGRDCGNEPWIKIGDVLLEPAEIRELCNAVSKLKQRQSVFGPASRGVLIGSHSWPQ